MNATRDDAINENIMDLAMTLTSIDRGLVRITERPSADKTATFAMTLHTNHPFGKNDKLLLPLDERVGRDTDFDAVNSVDAVKRVMQSPPFSFVGHEDQGFYLSETPLRTVVEDAMGEAILTRARKWSAQQ